MKMTAKELFQVHKYLHDRGRVVRIKVNLKTGEKVAKAGEAKEAKEEPKEELKEEPKEAPKEELQAETGSDASILGFVLGRAWSAILQKRDFSNKAHHCPFSTWAMDNPPSSARRNKLNCSSYTVENLLCRYGTELFVALST
ncbi:hypothetical protein LZ32DRAFT_616769 [Colletotrichum eremochloae]|nr:hypothetical protein LZ32DRAFT_616769 [Colletotrichum eremochloae]